MSWYYDFEPTRPIETDKGIKAKSKRGKFVKNWWASRWITAMEQVMDRNRLQRGKRYARKGQVVELTEQKGKIMAKVQGSRPQPYKVTISLTPLNEQSWEKVIEALTERPYFVAQLLAGEMPQEIEEAFQAVSISLFPSKQELKQECNCPDWAAVCKHLAAVHYILGERFDEDPFLLFRLRGISQEELLASLGTGAAVAGEIPTPEYPPAPPLADELDSVWQMGREVETVSMQIERPEDNLYPVLERLGEPDFMPKARRWLTNAYTQVTEIALEIAYDEK